MCFYEQMLFAEAGDMQQKPAADHFSCFDDVLECAVIFVPDLDFEKKKEKEPLKHAGCAEIEGTEIHCV